MPTEVDAADLVRMGILTEFHLELSTREQVKDALKHPAVLRHATKSDMYTLTQKLDGSCHYLDKNFKCAIYDNRPATCRNHPQVGPRPGFCAYIKKPGGETR
jgi:Fe-S-cluster containining protein